MKIYGDTNSGNCLKVKWVCDHLALPYTWIAVDTRKGETRTPEFLKLNGAGQVPTVVLDDGRRIRVRSDWSGGGVEAAFLRDLRDGACEWFDVVLGPDYNAAHRDHFHFDRGRGRVCR